jgi:hypothetical protein
MKKLFYLPIAAFLLFGCKERTRDVTMSQPINLGGSLSNSQTNAGRTVSQPVSGNTASVKTNPAHGQPGHRCDLAVGAPLSAPVTATIPGTQPQPVVNVGTPVNIGADQIAAAAKQSTGKLNPEHGKPGHRCDIPVGAPLSTPVQKTQPVTTTTTAAASPAPTPTLPGMNPQHGQPGHRCDIAIGAPLNSPKPEEKKDTSGKG